MKFLLDTNFLMLPGQTRARIYEQLRGFPKAELYAADLSVKELERIAQGRGKAASEARVGLALMRSENVKVIDSGSGFRNTDRAIIDIASRDGMVVCTADRELKYRLRARGIETVTVRQRRYIEVD